MELRLIAFGVLLVLASGCADGSVRTGTAATAPQNRQLDTSASHVNSTGEDVQRSAASQVSSTVTSMTVGYTSPSVDGKGKALKPRDLHRVVAGHAVKELIAALNELPVPDMGHAMCPEDDNERFVVSMDNAGRSLSFRMPGCGRIVVVADGLEQPELWLTAKLDALVAAAAGAPVAT
jgi:hypothetical protein